ncbi:aminotransferase class V-fold PLP-dependent enzyme [Sphingomonas oligoaromativorans]|uniref:aminotransferase class V-fold PLP-dependent enzyme n=1 Tax=Sphingomonas oligoaromativorans TaxID=575322 RepID=UPI001424696E|nr:aminotransferase class V-fold PLP-dependent enzyme [Sphingomonas oligoaromativorans]NIJ31912.1 selenocysteine lyase/cysteine desulfurase [Sphingomonas oligoaromativorans]
MRAHFHMPEGVYLLSHSVGCLPRGSEAAVAEAFYQPWSEAGGDAWPAWLGAVTGFREAVARLIGARVDQVCPQTNVSGAVAKIIHALPERAGRDVILLSEEDFPSIGFVASAAAARGYRTRFLPRGAEVEDAARWAAEMAAGDVQVALVTHAFSNRSARLPVDAITRAARREGVFTIVDAVQTLGVVPVDVAEWAADFVVGSSVKFLCGGPGAAFLWVADPALAATDPIDVGWFSHANPFAFDIHDFRAAGDASRFWGGTPSVLPFAQGAYSIGRILDIGVETIHAHNQGLIQRLHDALPGRIHSARERRGNAVLVAVDDAAATLAKLREACLFVDAREGCIRLSPHIYNSADDIDRLVAAI